MREGLANGSVSLSAFCKTFTTSPSGIAVIAFLTLWDLLAGKLT